MVLTAASTIAGSSHGHLCHADGSGCSTSYTVTNTSMKIPFGCYGFTHNFVKRCNGFMHWIPVGRELCKSKVLVAADYSDSVPHSSNNYKHNQGYHPLEELKVRKKIRDTKLTPAEISRTTVEANNSASLVFPSEVHCEPHGHVTWADYQYVIDEYGDIFFEIFDDENILEDRGGSNPVNVLIGMDIKAHGNRRLTTAEYYFSNTSISYDIPFEDDYFEVEDILSSDIPVDWGMPVDDNGISIHPLYFAKCLSKAVNMEYSKKMDHPSNGVSIIGVLRPAFMDEESHIRRLFNDEIIDGYNSDGKDGDVWDFTAWRDGVLTSSRFYKLEIMKMELFSVYGIQLEIGLQEFQDAEPDILVHFMPSIIQNLNEKGTRCNSALRALCKKKGLKVEGANLIGVDSLGMDVRVLSGVEVQTHRFPFKVRATSESTAGKQIQQLLFPRARRKKMGSHGNSLLKDYE